MKLQQGNHRAGGAPRPRRAAGGDGRPRSLRLLPGGAPVTAPAAPGAIGHLEHVDLDDLDPEAAMIEAVGSLYAEVVEALRAAPTALDAELALSDLFGSLDAEAPPTATAADRAAVLEAMAGGLALCAEQGRSPFGVAVLRALAAVGPESVRGFVAEALDRTLRAGARSPRWAEGIGRAVPVRAWVHGDIWGRQESLGMVFGGGQGVHLVAVLVDHDLGGGIKDAWCTEEVASVEAQMRAGAGSAKHTRMTTLSLPEARAMLEAALAEAECPVEPDQFRDVAAHRALLRARLSAWTEVTDRHEPVGADQVARIKIGLVGAKPPIWRRLEVPGDITLGDVHATIQAAFGWDDSHLHAFAGRWERYADPFHSLEETVDETDVPLLEALENGRLTYTYDFGDDWEHRIELEAVGPPEPGVVYPRCVGGRRAAPPDDIGGIYRYSWLVAAAADRCDPDRDDADAQLAQWGVHAPAKFDAGVITRALRPLGRVPATPLSQRDTGRPLPR